MQQIKAIQTKYKGFYFRSRLEARYAVMFDSIGVHWDYEPEGFILSNGERYLPDFLVTTRYPLFPKVWIEVKGMQPTDSEKIKLSLLARATRLTSYFLIGSPGENPLESMGSMSMTRLIHRGGHDFDSTLKFLIYGIQEISYEQIVELHLAKDAAKSARFEFEDAR